MAKHETTTEKKLREARVALEEGYGSLDLVAELEKAVARATKRNKAARECSGVMRDLGMVRTKYGWE